MFNEPKLQIYSLVELQEEFGSVHFEMGPMVAFFEEEGIKKVYTTWQVGFRGMKPRQEGPWEIKFCDKDQAIDAFKWSLRNLLHHRRRCVIRLLPVLTFIEYIDNWDEPRMEYQVRARFYLE